MLSFKKTKILSVLAAVLLWQPVSLNAVEPIDIGLGFDFDFDLNLTIAQDLFVYDFSDIGTLNTGFTIVNPNLVSLNIQSVFFPQLGLQTNQGLQNGFVLYDGTLLLEATATDPNSARAAIRTTYRMNFDGREMLGREFLRARFVRQGRYTEARARARARAASIADARIMRLVENETGARWVRAVRAIRGRAEIRFMPRQAADGVLGHYGYDIGPDGSSYVWAVMDTNSQYAVGLNVDDDDDGVFNATDNCRNTANADQMDYDGDGIGDACDADDDNDGFDDAADNCPLAANADQADQDGDGFGDACDADDDNDGVNDGADQCPTTAAGALVDSDGCSIEDRCPCENESGWKNHGAYVRCVAHRSEAFLEAGLISEAEKDAIVSTAGQSACGARR